MLRIVFSLILTVLCVVPSMAQELNLGTAESFEDVVEPIITRQEREIYDKLVDGEARLYFQSIFWYKRDTSPGTAANEFKRAYYQRRQEANFQFGEGDTPGTKTDRGQLYLLLGEPADVAQRQLPGGGARPTYEEVWQYPNYDLRVRFQTDSRTGGYVMQERTVMRQALEKIRYRQVIDRAEPYQLKRIPLTLPNLGITKDIENLTADVKNDLGYVVSYDFFEGDLNRSEVFVGITFLDASPRGVTIHLTAFDPYANKVIDYKKAVQPTNGEMVSFTIALEPDQYDMLLRMDDKDGRASIDRRKVDVPRVGGGQATASSLYLSPGLQPVPLQGFLAPKKFVFDDLYFPIQNHLPGFDGGRLYLMQHFYNYGGKPEVSYFINHQPVEARIEADVAEGRVLRRIVSIPFGDRGAGPHHVKSVFSDQRGNLKATGRFTRLDGAKRPSRLLAGATVDDGFRLVLPANNKIEDLDRVVVRANDGVTIQRMYVIHNGILIYEQDKAPWEVRIPEDRLAFGGDNELTIIVATDQGTFYRKRTFEPLRVAERIRTRVVQIFFNAFNQENTFVSNLNLAGLRVTVDGESVEPKEVKKVEEPITYCFLVDTSFSMQQSFSTNMGALRKFVESMRPEDRGYFIEFSDNYWQYSRPTVSKAVLLAVATQLRVHAPNVQNMDRIQGENNTYIYDSVITAIQSLAQFSGRKVIILVSDGKGIEGVYPRNGMLSYARQNDVVIFTLWLDNNPIVSDDDLNFLRTEKTRTEKVLRAIGLSRLFSDKDTRQAIIGSKIRQSSINEGLLKILAEESGGFHYRVFMADRSLIRDYVADIEAAMQNQYLMTLNLPIAPKAQTVDIKASEPDISIRNKSRVKVRISNPLLDTLDEEE